MEGVSPLHDPPEVPDNKEAKMAFIPVTTLHAYHVSILTHFTIQNHVIAMGTSLR